METIKINKVSPDGGYEPAIAEYDAKFSAVYALCLYICQYIWHVNYLDRRQIERARKCIGLGKGNKGCYFWDGNGATYSALAPLGKVAFEGEFGSKFDFEPTKIK